MVPLPARLNPLFQNKTFRRFLALALLGLGPAAGGASGGTDPLLGSWEGTLGQGVESFRLAIVLTSGHCFYNQIDDGLYDVPLTRDPSRPIFLLAHTGQGATLKLQLGPSGRQLTGIFRQEPNPNAVESLVKTGVDYPVTLTPGKDFLYPRLDDKGHRVTRYSYHPPQ